MHAIFQPLANLTSVHSVQFLRLTISFASAAVLHSILHGKQISPHSLLCQNHLQINEGPNTANLFLNNLG